MPKKEKTKKFRYKQDTKSVDKKQKVVYNKFIKQRRIHMRIYVNKHKDLILKFDFEKFGGIPNETIQLKSGELTKEIEQEVFEAMQEIIERWQPFLDNIPTEELFAEKQKQVRAMNDFETVLTD